MRQIFIFLVMAMQLSSGIFTSLVDARERGHAGGNFIPHLRTHPVHLAYTIGPFVKYAKWENGQVTDRQLVDNTNYAKGFLDLKKDDDDQVYLAYAINRNIYNTHWFIMFKDFQTGTLETLPVTSPCIPLGVSLQVQGTGAQKEFLITVALQNLSLPNNVQQVHLFRKHIGAQNWNSTILFSNYQQSIALQPHLNTALDQQGLLHVFFSQKQINAQAVSVHELEYDLNQRGVLGNYTVSTANGLNLQGTADRFDPLDGEMSSNEAYAAFSANPSLIGAKRDLTAPLKMWQFLNNFPQALGVDMEIYQHTSDDYMALAAVENGQFTKGGTDLNFYFSAQKKIQWNRVSIEQGKTYYSPSLSIPTTFPTENIFLACTAEESPFLSTLYLYTHAPYDLTIWGSVVIDQDLNLTPEINHVQIVQ